MNTLLLKTFTLLLALWGSLSERCDRFHLKQAGISFENNTVYYRVGILSKDVDSDAPQFKVKIEHAGDGDGNTEVTALYTEHVSQKDGVYTFGLNQAGKKMLNRERRLPTCPHIYIPMKVKHTRSTTLPEITALSIGDYFRCDASTLRPPRRRGCKRLTDRCPRAVRWYNGFSLKLDVTKFRSFYVKIGFASKVQGLMIKKDGTIRKVISRKECERLFYFDVLRRRSRGPVVLAFKIKNGDMVPNVTFIEYGDFFCNGSCGRKPDCQVTPTVDYQTPTEVATERWKLSKDSPALGGPSGFRGDES